MKVKLKPAAHKMDKTNRPIKANDQAQTQALKAFNKEHIKIIQKT